MFRRFFPPILVLVLPVLFESVAAPCHGQTVYVSRMWHNHQPLYWPEWNGNGGETMRKQYAWDSIVLKGGQTYGTTEAHPSNDLVEIFGKSDRVGSYQDVPRNSLANLSTSAGFCLSYSGSLIDNIRNLGANNQLGYWSGWWNGNREAKNWTTPLGGRRLDLVGFTYHHSLAPCLPKEVFRKELQIMKQAWWKAWGGNSDLNDHSKGFFPTEMAFTTEMIDVLVDEGYEWSIVASHHLSRTCPTYNDRVTPQNFGIESSPPNRADQIGPSPTSGWWFLAPQPGMGTWNVSPFAYQLHRAKYVNPATGAEKSLILVPSDDSQSYRAGYSGAEIGIVSGSIAPHATDPNRPVLVMASTDGDNAWGGGSSSWFESTPAYFRDCEAAGYQPVAVQDLVNTKPPPVGEYVHVEDGAWIFPISCYGSPYFLKWVEPPVKPGSPNRYGDTLVDLETPGFALKFWSWAVVMTGANWCETAEQIFEDDGGTVEAWKIQAPYDWDGTWTNPNVVERAWHIYLAGLDSGFNYYGGLGNDDEVKPSLATRRAIEILDDYMSSRLGSDRTPPSVFRPQRFPWNPGGYSFGWFNSVPEGDKSYLKTNPSDFYIWTHVYDVSGVESVNLKVRLDADGVNTMANNQNETYSGGEDVGSWITIPMTKRVLPNERSDLNAAANNGQIDYFITPPHLADYYFAKISDLNLAGFRDKLIDYYIEATDTKGNLHKSEIQHVYVEDDGAGPLPPEPGAPSELMATALAHDRVQLMWTAGSDATSYEVFRDGVKVGTAGGTQFADGGLEASTTYHYTVWSVNRAGNSALTPSVAVRTSPAPPPEFVMDGQADYSSYLQSNPGMTIYAALRGTKLYVATWSTGNGGWTNDHFILVSDTLLPSATTLPPWDKAGRVAVPAGKPFLGAESSNAFAGWFNAPGSSTVMKAADSGGQLEGVIDLAEAFGTVPPVVHIAALAYATDPGGALQAQAPAVVTLNDDVEPEEFLTLATPALLDRNADGLPDRADPKMDFIAGIQQGMAAGGRMIVSWASIPGRSYQVEYTDGLTPPDWRPLPGGAVTASGITHSIEDTSLTGQSCRFYRVSTAAP